HDGDEHHPKRGDDVRPAQPERPAGYPPGLGVDAPLRKSCGWNDAVYGCPFSPGVPSGCPLTVSFATLPELSWILMRAAPWKSLVCPLRMVDENVRWPSTTAVTCRGCLAWISTLTVGPASAAASGVRGREAVPGAAAPLLSNPGAPAAASPMTAMETASAQLPRRCRTLWSAGRCVGFTTGGGPGTSSTAPP